MAPQAKRNGPATRKKERNLIKVIPIDVTTFSKHPDAARKFVEFCVSDEGFLLGQRLAIMNRGQVGEPTEVFCRTNSEFAAEFLGMGNLFKGDAVAESGISRVRVGNIDLVSVVPLEGSVHVSIRAEHILLSLTPIESSAGNAFMGPVQRIADSGPTLQVTLDIGIPLTATVARRSFEDMGLAVGKAVHATFKAADVHVFPSS